MIDYLAASVKAVWRIGTKRIDSPEKTFFANKTMMIWCPHLVVSVIVPSGNVRIQLDHLEKLPVVIAIATAGHLEIVDLVFFAERILTKRTVHLGRYVCLVIRSLVILS